MTRMYDDERECLNVCDRDELSTMCAIGEKLRKFLFTESNRVSKTASEYVLNCVSEYEMQMMRMLGKNERLRERIEECEKNVER